MIAYVPVARPMIAVAQDGSIAAIVEPDRVTFVTVPAALPFGVVNGAGLQAGWLGAPPDLLVLAQLGEHVIARLVDPRVPRVTAERLLDAGVRLRACVDRFAVVEMSGGELAILDERLAARPLARSAAVVGCLGSLIAIAGDSSIDAVDPATGGVVRSWPAPQVALVGGTARSPWWTSRQAPTVLHDTAGAIDVAEPIVEVAGHAASGLIVVRGTSGRVDVVDRERERVPRAVDVGVRAEAIALAAGPAGVYVLAAEAHRPTAAVEIVVAPRPTWRDELVAWTRSGVVARVPIVDAIEALARRLELPEELTPAITLCYGAHLCGTGVPPVELAQLLGGRWEEALGAGRLAAAGVLVNVHSRVCLAPAIARLLDAL